MQNANLIDIFLASMCWLTLMLIYHQVVKLIRRLNQKVDSQAFQVHFSRVVKLATVVSLPLLTAFSFTLWRFYALMIQTNIYGIGGIGLLVMMVIVGFALIWLRCVLGLIDLATPNITEAQPTKNINVDSYGREL